MKRSGYRGARRPLESRRGIGVYHDSGDDPAGLARPWRSSPRTRPIPEDQPIDAVLGLVVVVVLVSANAFFVAAEFALVAVDRTQLDVERSRGNKRAEVASGLVSRLSHHLSGAQLGITITSLVLGFLAEPTVARLLRPALEPVVGAGALDSTSILLALLIATGVQMVMGELVPKTVAIARPLPAALVLAGPIRLYDWCFGWVISGLDRAANWTVRRLGVEPADELSTVRSLPELALLFQASADEGVLDDRATTLLRRSIRFGDKTAADVLVPRTAMVAVALEDSAQDLVNLARRTGRSRLPVYGGDLDDVRGVVHIKRVHAVEPSERSITPVSELMSPAVFVPETRRLDDLLVDIQSSRTHLVLVADEYGGIAGLVTLEDVLEEIVGAIADESDHPDPDLTVRQSTGEWLLSGALHPDEVFDACGFDIPDGEYETLAGFVLDRLGFVPDGPGTSFDHQGWSLTVVAMDRLRVAEVRLRAPDAEDAGGADLDAEHVDAADVVARPVEATEADRAEDREGSVERPDGEVRG